MRNVLMAAGVAATMAGCATTAGYEQMLGSWIGAPELALVRQWGTPVNTYQSGQSKFLTFSSNRTVFVPGVAPTYTSTRIGNTVYTQPQGGSPAYTVGKTCVTTFEVVDERVVSWRWEGNDCKAKPRK